MRTEPADTTILSSNLTSSSDQYVHRNRDRSRKGSYYQVNRQTRFIGRCEELNGNIYDCNDSRQADQYSIMTKEVAEYIGRTYRYRMDTRLAIENLQYATCKVSKDPDENATKTT
jgi:hypothetical protein